MAPRVETQPTRQRLSCNDEEKVNQRIALMGWTPPDGIYVPKWRCYRTT
jgi:hypothetical protein